MKRRKGFTLIEILIAMIIFTFGLMVYAGALVIDLKTILHSRDSIISDSVAANLAEDDLMQLESDSSAVLSNGTKDLAVKTFVVKAGEGDATGDVTVSFHLRKYKANSKKPSIFILVQR